MAVLALHNTTFSELQQFLQSASMPLSKKFTVIFNQDAHDLGISDESKDEPINENQLIDFSQLPAFGMWADREEMADSVEYIRKLRRERWTSHND